MWLFFHFCLDLDPPDVLMVPPSILSHQQAWVPLRADSANALNVSISKANLEAPRTLTWHNKGLCSGGVILYRRS